MIQAIDLEDRGRAGWPGSGDRGEITAPHWTMGCISVQWSWLAEEMSPGRLGRLIRLARWESRFFFDVFRILIHPPWIIILILGDDIFCH